MDAKKLMCNDWVRSIYDQSVYKFCRLTRNHECHCDTSEKLNFNDDLSPVDITTKILRESGFEVYDLNPTYNTFWRQKDDKDGQEIYNIEIDKYFGDDYYSIDIRHIGHGFIKKRIRYVHELQQCLRIVDLDEIVNCIKV